MKIRFFHATVLPLDGHTPMFAGEVHTDGAVITHVGKPPADMPKFDREIDCGGNLLIPGFKNAHAHGAMTFLRSLADDMPLQTWLFDYVFPRERLLTPDDILHLTKLAILEYLTSGITAAFDMYLHRDAVAQAAVETGFRTVIVNATNDFGGTPEEQLMECERFSSMGPLVSYQYGIHAEYTTSLPLLKDMASLMQTVKKPFWSHMNETAAEVEGCVERHGKRPFELLASLGLFDYGGGGYHCVHVSASEMEIMRACGLTAVTCPASNLKLGSGVAPVYEMMERGIPVAIGTDGPASNNCLDFFREMFLVTGLQKVRHGADKVDATRVLEMACRNGAVAMGLTDCDCLAVGKQADMALIDLSMPNMQPTNNIEKNLVYSGSKQNVRMTVVAGNILYDRGQFFIGEEPRALYERANAIVKRMAL